jgi:hypothetical protein
MPHALLRLIETFVRPQALYACQVWGSNFLFPNQVNACALQPVYTGFLKHLLQVKKSVANDIVFSEVNQKPLQYFWLKACVTFWNACLASNSPLLKRVVHSDAVLASGRVPSRACWSFQFQAAVRKYCADECLLRDGVVQTLDLQNILKGWQDKYDATWADLPDNPRDTGCLKRKRATYKAWFKDPKGFLPRYLGAGNDLNKKVVHDMARFRVGNHGLRVEKGHFTSPALPYTDRICLRCSKGVDDEHHLVFDCDSTQHLRNDVRYSHLFNTADLRDFMNQQDWKGVACFISACMRVASDDHE